LCERALGTSDRTKYYLVHLPSSASLRALVRLTHQRWAIEQQYQELKDELGLDHFEGRSLPGWQRHVVLTAHFYVTRPHYLRTMQKLAEIDLRI
jgi:SRSO17 transposase